MVRGLLGSRAARDLRVGPEKEGVDHGLGVGEAIVAFRRAGQAPLPDLRLDPVARPAACQGRGHGPRLQILGPLKGAPGVGLIWRSR